MAGYRCDGCNAPLKSRRFDYCGTISSDFPIEIPEVVPNSLELAPVQPKPDSNIRISNPVWMVAVTFYVGYLTLHAVGLL